MLYTKPKKKHIIEAFNDHKVDYSIDDRERSRDSWANGLKTVTAHHTAGRNSLNYLATAWNLPGANCVIQHGQYNGQSRDGHAVILAFGSAWHSGQGGPWRGVAGKDSLHMVSWGIEIESLGTKKDMTLAQIETVGRMLAAFNDLGVPLGNINRHADWTDGTDPVGGYPLPTRGRKIDTRKEWYPTKFWVEQAKKFIARDRTGITGPAAVPKRGDLWDGTVPFYDIVFASFQHGDADTATYRLACRLRDLGHFTGSPVQGQQTYPTRAVAAWQRSRGYKPTGNWGPKAQKLLFGK